MFSDDYNTADRKGVRDCIQRVVHANAYACALQIMD